MSKTVIKAGGFSEREMNRRLDDRLRERAMSAPMTLTCAVCGDTFEGPAGAAIDQHREHRRLEHPELRVQARKSGTSRARRRDLAPDEQAAIDEERLRRARLHGIEEELTDA